MSYQPALNRQKAPRAPPLGKANEALSWHPFRHKGRLTNEDGSTIAAVLQESDEFVGQFAFAARRHRKIFGDEKA